MIYGFEDCELDTGLCELRRRGQPVHLEPQAFDVLRYLLEQRDRLVPKEELLERVWGERFVTPSALNSRIKMVRQALGDDGQTQRVIKTVRGRGFRFVAAVTADVRERSAAPAVSAQDERSTVIARPAEQTRLHALFGEAKDGKRRLVLVRGESGVGKTVLIESFLGDLAAAGVRVARGQCLEQHGVGEPYLPMLAALGRLGRSAEGEAVVELLRRYAPSWLLQMPSLLPANARQGLEGQASSATRQRMLREMVEALEALARDAPLVLVVEDVHWSDPSTLDLLLWIGQRPDPARLLMLVSYRSEETGSELRAVLDKLRPQPCCAELTLNPWTGAEIASYLSVRFPVHAFPEGLATLMLQRTGGNPLFVRSLVDGWLESGVLLRSDGSWGLTGDLDVLAHQVPATLRDTLERRVESLPQADLEILQAAAVVGREFASAAVAAALERGDEEVETRCTGLARQAGLVRAGDSVEWSDGTLSAGFSFHHDLYREVLYDRIPLARRARLHVRIGVFLETALGGQARERAGELASHFERGRDDERAVRYLALAARQALRRSAYAEATRHGQAGMRVLGRRSDLPNALELELQLQQVLGPALLELHGWGNADAERAYERSREIAVQLEDPSQLGSALYGLAYLHEIRGEYPRAQEMVRERLRLSDASEDTWAQLEAHDLLSCSLLHVGRFEDSLANARRAIECFERDRRYEELALFGHHPAVSSYYWAGLALWFIGYPDQGVELVRSACELAVAAKHSFSLAFAESRMSRVYQLRGEEARAAEHARAALELAEQQCFPYQRALALTLSGWAAAMRDDVKAGVRAIREGLSIQREMGAVMDLPYGLGLLADALLVAGDLAAVIETTDEALKNVRGGGGTFFWEAELRRLRAVAMHRGGDADGAESELQGARAVAQAQRARSLELRVALSLAEVYGHSGRREEARVMIRELFDWFTEGFEAPDLQQARRLVEG